MWSGDVKLGPLTLKCHVLNNGQRVIEEESVAGFIAFMESPDAGATLTKEDVEAYLMWMRGITPRE